MPYTPGPMPQSRDFDGLLKELWAELQKIQSGTRVIVMPKRTIAPTKPLEGQIEFADGTTWDPGSGKGIYYWDGAAWQLLG